ncbi:MAG: phosphoheptose isomerase [Solirubrobacterales bacterium]|nr:phosphoheptose isomerase [Solirubrobacterales bacterium]
MQQLVAERERVLEVFLEREQQRIILACRDLAATLKRGGTLLVHGSGSAATDAAHVAVEFLHPVIVGKRALPALAPSNDITRTSDVAALLRPDDALLVLAHGPADRRTRALLASAAARGNLTIALVGDGGTAPDADHVLAVPSADPCIVQEVQETTYHVLWEQVHVLFDHPGVLEEACITCGDVAVSARVVALTERGALIERDGAREEVACELVAGVTVGDVLLCHAGVALDRIDEDPTAPVEDPTAFLYPFLHEQAASDAGTVLEDLRASTLAKAADVIALRRAIDLEAVRRCAAAVRVRLMDGGRLLTFGNGGSTTDAQDAAADARAAGWPAVALTDDVSTITAVANDVGFENVFSRQLIPLGRKADVALAISTSGSSPNLVAGLEEAHRRGMLTCAIIGHDGGRIAALPWVDHVLLVRSDYVPRIQEAQATTYHLIIDAIGART